MSQYNPYAPPADDAPVHRAQGPSEGIWCKDGQLVVHKIGGRLPDRCVVCNAPAHGYKLRKTFAWHPPEYYITIIAGLLIYVIVAMVSRKTALVELGLCEQHRARRRNGLIIAWAGFAGSFCLMFVGAAGRSGKLFIGSVVGLVVVPLAGALVARVVYPTKIDNEYAWFRVGKPFLDSLPPA
jgi:hypothetical protein